jgi:hypothetical protein
MNDIPVRAGAGHVIFQESSTFAKAAPSSSMVARLLAVGADGGERLLGEYFFQHTRTIPGPPGWEWMDRADLPKCQPVKRLAARIGSVRSINRVLPAQCPCTARNITALSPLETGYTWQNGESSGACRRFIMCRCRDSGTAGHDMVAAVE